MARMKVLKPEIEDPAKRAREGLPPLPRVDLTNPEIRKALGMKVIAGVHKETAKAADESRPPSRVNGWDEDLDHTKRHALVDADGNVLWMIAPHVKGSINGGPQAIAVDMGVGQRIVRVKGEYTDQARELYRAHALVVNTDGRMEVASGARYQRAKADVVDESTMTSIRNGAPWKGRMVSLSPNAISKYTAARSLASTLAYPYTFSAMDNAEEVVIGSESEMEEFTSSVLGHYLQKLADGDTLKGRIRKARTPRDVDRVLG